MRVLVDTNVIIDHLRGIPEATAYLRNIQNGELSGVLSVVSITELFAAPQMTKEDVRTIEEVLQLFDKVVEVDPTIARTAGELLAAHHKSSSLDPVDALIASTAIHSDALLVTRNEKHFKPISGLIVINPLQD